jgi:MFS family permease
VAVGSEMPTASREPASSRWGPFARIAFTTIWVGNIVYNTGNAMWDAGSPVLMASLNASPLILSLIQVAISLPIFLLTLPAGAITDIVDLRRLLIAVESISAAVAAVFAFLVELKVATPFSLLISTFLLGVCGALAAPGWVAIVPLLVPPRELEGAIAANTVGYNMTRAIGPMFGGLVIAEYGIAAPFWSCSVSHLAIIAALIFWRGRGRCADPNPTQDLRSAFGDGLRHAANNRGLRATLVRAVAFCLFASAYWALLPVVAEKQMGAAPELYGFLLGAIGVGAIAGSFVLGCPDLKEINALLARSLRGAVAARVRDAQREGDVAAGLHPEAVAEFLIANIAGIRVAGRGGTDRASLTSLADMVLRALR